jgi:arylsulfatase
MPGALRPPNILLLFCDQLRADVLGCYGHPFAVTPAIDGLAARGTVFDSAYTPSPVCVPARCSLVFGAEPGETGCHDNGFPMPGDPPSLMSRLADQGYRTHGVGKMHFSGRPPERWGFHTRDVGEEFGTAAGDDYVRFLAERGYGHVERPHGLRSEMYYLPQLSPVPEQLHYSHWVADRSLDFLRTRPRDQPFFLWSSFIHPHPPFAPPSPWHRLYPPALMPDPRRPPSGAELLTVHNIKQNRYKFRDGGEDRRGGHRGAGGHAGPAQCGPRRVPRGLRLFRQALLPRPGGTGAAGVHGSWLPARAVPGAGIADRRLADAAGRGG